MRIPTAALLILCTAVFSATAAGGGSAEEAKPFDFKPLIPPVLPPLPPSSSVTSGAVGGTQTPYTTAPLQNPTQRPSHQAGERSKRKHDRHGHATVAVKDVIGLHVPEPTRHHGDIGRDRAEDEGKDRCENNGHR